MAERKTLTDVGIRAAVAAAKKSGKARWIADGGIIKGKGGLQIHVTAAGVGRWYWRYSAPDGRKVRMPIGPLAYESTPGSLTLPEAREEVLRLAGLYADPESRDVRAHLERERERKAAEKEAAEAVHFAKLRAEVAEADAAERERVARQAFTVQAMFDAYVAHLRAKGKQSAADAESLFRNNVTRPRPLLAGKLANQVTRDEIVEMLRAVVESGRGRTAAKLRAYLRACYGLAVRAKGDATVPSAFMGFGVEWNPVQDTGTMAEFNRTRDRALSEAELRAFLTSVKALPDGPARDALLLLLYTGGQRPTQLVRATPADVDLSAHTLTLRDGKGRRTQARVHLVPLTAEAEEVASRCLERAKAAASPWLLSTHGKLPLHAQTLTEAVRQISVDMNALPNGERIATAPFGLRDLRRTCESRLAALGVSKDLRAQLQSHGLGGVQARHYDRHDYLDEKRAALVAWCAFLEARSTANVHQLRQSAA